MTRMLLAATSSLALLMGCAHSRLDGRPWPAAAPRCWPPVHEGRHRCRPPTGGGTITFTTTGRSAPRRWETAANNQHHSADTSPQGMLEAMSPSHPRHRRRERLEHPPDPSHPGDPELQAEVRMRAHRMRLNGCGMMEQAREADHLHRGDGRSPMQTSAGDAKGDRGSRSGGGAARSARLDGGSRDLDGLRSSWGLLVELLLLGPRAGAPGMPTLRERHDARRDPMRPVLDGSRSSAGGPRT